MGRPSKRPRLGDAEAPAETDGRPALLSLTRPISPVERARQATQTPDVPADKGQKIVRSPFALTRIRDLPASANVDAVSLGDILGDPLISECWEFNFLHDVDFLMSAFDRDIRDHVRVHVVHGFWKQEDPNRRELQRQASRYKNVALHSAFLPEMFGTHHSKMLILLRRDDAAQVVIHTANMIPRDWGNMTQAVWRSPLLPLLPEEQPADETEQDKIGTGARFKSDLLAYLRAYDRRRVTCRPIAEALAQYDFSAVRAGLIASVPGRHNVRDDSSPRWGWAAMKQALGRVPVGEEGDKKAEVVVQVSSIATLGPTDSWLRTTMFGALSSSRGDTANKVTPNFKVVFPTADEIRRSLDGYGSGASIHTKVQSPQQAKQLQYLRPILCHWANDAPDGQKITDEISEAGRKRAAPHVKTYIRHGDRSIDWALLTSANLSKQAWGEAADGSGEMRLASYEIGVLVWPSLYGDEAKMVPTFLTDEPSLDEDDRSSVNDPVVGLRVPYNLPLQRYGGDEVPWVATASHSEPDWQGRTWER